MYKVEYYTDTGTRGDNEFIGIYSSPELASDAKEKYILSQVGPKDREMTADELEDYEYDLQRLEECVVIEPIQNLF